MPLVSDVWGFPSYGGKFPVANFKVIMSCSNSKVKLIMKGFYVSIPLQESWKIVKKFISRIPGEKFRVEGHLASHWFQDLLQLKKPTWISSISVMLKCLKFLCQNQEIRKFFIQKAAESPHRASKELLGALNKSWGKNKGCWQKRLESLCQTCGMRVAPTIHGDEVGMAWGHWAESTALLGQRAKRNRIFVPQGLNWEAEV